MGNYISFSETTMSRPEFVSQLADIWVKVGEPLSLECKARGIPLTETLWLRDGQEVSNVPVTFALLLHHSKTL